MHILVPVAFALIIASMISALYFMMHDRGRTKRMVWSLATRVGLSISLFLFILFAHWHSVWALTTSAISGFPGRRFDSAVPGSPIPYSPTAKRRPDTVEGGALLIFVTAVLRVTLLWTGTRHLRAPEAELQPASQSASQPIDDDVQPQPHDVNKVPIPRGAFKREVMVRREMAANHANQHHGQHRAAEEHVETVEACQ